MTCKKENHQPLTGLVTRFLYTLTLSLTLFSCLFIQGMQEDLDPELSQLIQSVNQKNPACLCHDTAKLVYETLSGKTLDQSQLAEYKFSDMDLLKKIIFRGSDQFFLHVNLVQGRTIAHTFIIEGRGDRFRIFQSFFYGFGLDEWVTGLIQDARGLEKLQKNLQELKKHKKAVKRTINFLDSIDHPDQNTKELTKEARDIKTEVTCEFQKVENIINGIVESKKIHKKLLGQSISRYGKGQFLSRAEFEIYLNKLSALMKRVGLGKGKPTNARRLSQDLFGYPLWKQDVDPYSENTVYLQLHF